MGYTATVGDGEVGATLGSAVTPGVVAVEGEGRSDCEQNSKKDKNENVNMKDMCEIKDKKDMRN